MQNISGTVWERLRGLIHDAALLPWEQREKAVREGLVAIDSIWPVDAHWLPPTWREARQAIDEDDVEQDVLLRQTFVRESPTLATLAFSINQVYPLLPHSAAAYYLNNHLMLGGAIIGCSTDMMIQLSQERLEVLYPSPATVVDDSKLPDFTHVLHRIDLFRKLSLKKEHQIPFNNILKKGLPLTGSDKQIDEMVSRECGNEIFYRTFTYMVLCVICGTYDWLEREETSETCYDFVVQCWIVHHILYSNRSEMVAVYSESKNRDVMLYACTAAFVAGLETIPPLQDLVYECYDWDSVVSSTRRAICNMRQKLAESYYAGVFTRPGQLFDIVREHLETHSKVVNDEFRTLKSELSSIVPNVRKAGRDIVKWFSKYEMSGLDQVNETLFFRYLSYAQKHGQGIDEDAMNEMDLTERGKVALRDVLQKLDSGDLSDPMMYVRLGPGDYSSFSAFVHAQRELLCFRVHPLCDRVRRRQERAIREMEDVMDWEPLPKASYCLPFCTVCECFKVYTAEHDRRGYKNVVYMPFNNKMYCKISDRPECCHLVMIDMLGKAVTVAKDTWILCCYCTKLCHYGNPDLVDSYWWCGRCERDLEQVNV